MLKIKQEVVVNKCFSLNNSYRPVEQLVVIPHFLSSLCDINVSVL